MSTRNHNSPLQTDSPLEIESVESARPPSRAAAGGQADDIANTPRTVIRGESQKDKTKPSFPAMTDWLNVSFPFYPPDSNPGSFFGRFSEVTGYVFGGMADQKRGLHGWKESFCFDRGGVRFAFGGQRNTAFLSLPGEGCAFISDWQALTNFLRDELRGHITRWDGAVDDYEGKHSVNDAIELYELGAFKNGGREPKPKQHGNWLTSDDLGRTFEVGTRKNGKLIRIYEKGKQLGDPTSFWVRWEVEFHAKDRTIPWDVLLYPGEYVNGAYPCMSWVSGRALHIHTIKAQDQIIYERLIQVAATAYGPLINVMMLLEGNAERVVELLRRNGVPRRLAFTDDYLRIKEGTNGL